jgi:hypothetical protein
VGLETGDFFRLARLANRVDGLAYTHLRVEWFERFVDL